MTKPNKYNDFKSTLRENEPPADWDEGLKAMWYDANDDWEGSHNIAQDMDNDLGSLIHAYLHRKEGDEFNAKYWYRRAHRDFPKVSLGEEHRQITESILLGEI